MTAALPDREVILHHLRLFGVADAPELLIRPDAAALEAALAQTHGAVIAVQPEVAACARLGLALRTGDRTPELHRYQLDGSVSWPGCAACIKRRPMTETAFRWLAPPMAERAGCGCPVPGGGS